MAEVVPKTIRDYEDKVIVDFEEDVITVSQEPRCVRFGRILACSPFV